MILSRATFKQTKFTASQVQVAKTPLATFESNVSGLYIPEILAYIQATQSGSGDPSPINPREISGVSSVDTTRTGKNLWSSGDVSGTRYVQITGLNIKTGTYTFSAVATSSDTDAHRNLVGFKYSDGTYDYISIGRDTRDSATVTLTDNVNTVRLFASHSNAHSVDDTFSFTDIQLEAGSTATPYEPYTGQTATTALGGTFYGGYVNVTTGLLTVTHALANLGDYSWTYDSNNQRFYTSTALSGADSNKPFLCDIYKYVGSFTQLVDKSCANIYNTRVGIKDLDYTDPIVFKNAMSGHTLLYELTTPQTYQLTPAQLEQLLGQNNVFCSSGDVAVKGWKID